LFFVFDLAADWNTNLEYLSSLKNLQTIIVLFNKVDIFKQRINNKSPLLKQTIPDYDETLSSDNLSMLAMKCVADTLGPMKTFYYHFGTAIDYTFMSFVWQSIERYMFYGENTIPPI